MVNKPLLFGILILILIIAIGSTAWFLFINEQKDATAPQLSDQLSVPANQAADKLIIVKQSGGAAMLDAKCADQNYITETADYIVEGAVQKAEAQWNEQRNLIITYVDFSIDKYVKGSSFGNELQLQVGGGCIDDICQIAEDAFQFEQGDQLRLYFHKTDLEFWIVCAQMGVESLSASSSSGRLIAPQ